MALLVDGKYKDDTPVHTVAKIQEILSGLGVETVEHWNNSMDGIYALRLEIAGTNTGTNGKGTSLEYTRASAYAELMERIQNQLLYFDFDISPEARRYGGFYTVPDEKVMSIDALLSDNNEVVNFFIPLTVSDVDKHDQPPTTLERKAQEWFPELAVDQRQVLAEKWLVDNPEEHPHDFITIPFYNVLGKKLTSVPWQMVRMPYGSNGMSAGNTLEEALVQGIAEIMERYVNQEMIRKKLTPPTVPDEIIQKFPAVAKILRDMEQSGQYQLLVKDCSLGLGFPVLAVVVIDRQTQSYYVKFGAHPAFEIALERCLTEIAQGRDVSKKLSGAMTSFAYFDRNAEHSANLCNIMRLGIGSYPTEFFAQTASYPFTEFADVQGLGNQEMLKSLTALLLTQGYNLLVRNVSYLGFPAVHVLVPGMSEIFEYDIRFLNSLALRVEAKKAVRNLGQASDQALKKILSFLIRRMPYAMEADNLTNVLPPVKSSFPWRKTANAYFIAAAFHKMKKMEEAYGTMAQLAGAFNMRKGMSNDVADSELSYIKCVRDYLHARWKNISEMENRSTLELFYGQEIVTKVFDEWGDSAEALRRFGVLNCWNCGECKFREHCSQAVIANIHMMLKDHNAQNVMNQMELEQIFAAVGV